MRKLILLVLVAAGLSGFAQTPFGNPSHATPEAKNTDNYLLVKQQYVLSYNNSKGTPNWVSWSVRKKDIGDAGRQNDFHAEKDLPAGFQRVTPADYDNSGYDRGHMCDSKDRTASVKDNQETFSMANMQPQAKKLNEVTWKALEDYSRTLVAKGDTLQIIAGCYGSRGHIGKVHSVNVPARCWKIVEDGATVIAVDMPNLDSVDEKPWKDYSVTVAAIEKATGFKFAIPKH